MAPEEYAKALQARAGASELAFPHEEYDARVAAARRAMAAAGLDAVLVTHVPDVAYLCGYSTFGSGNHACFVLPLEGDPALQVTALEVPAATVCARVEDVRVVPWTSQEGIGAQLARIVEERRLATSRLGVQGGIPGLVPSIEAQVREGLPDARFADASELVARLRLVKSPREIECLERAARYTEAGYRAAFAAIGAGVTDGEIAAAAAAGILGAGSEFMSVQPIVLAGGRTGSAHQNHRRFAVSHGDAVFLELGGCHLRYSAPLMRTATVGTPSPDVERAADAAIATLEAVLAHARPGVAGDEIARRAARAHAHLADSHYLPAACGYHVGLGFPPTWAGGIGFLAEGRHEPLEAGMVLHLPVAFRCPGRFGVGISETIRITPDGAEPLHDVPRALHVIDG